MTSLSHYTGRHSINGRWVLFSFMSTFGAPLGIYDDAVCIRSVRVCACACVFIFRCIRHTMPLAHEWSINKKCLVITCPTRRAVLPPLCRSLQHGVGFEGRKDWGLTFLLCVFVIIATETSFICRGFEMVTVKGCTVICTFPNR